MDQHNVIERIMDMTNNDHNITQLLLSTNYNHHNNQSPYPIAVDSPLLTNYNHNIINNNDNKQQCKQKHNDYLIKLSPNLKQRKHSIEIMGLQVKNYYQNNHYDLQISRRLMFDDQQNMSKWNFNNCFAQKQSSLLFPISQQNHLFCPSFKKTQSIQSPIIQKFNNKQLIDNNNKYGSSTSTFDFLNNKQTIRHQRGLKALSQIIYSILKNNQNTTFNTVAQLLVQSYRQRSVEQDGIELEERAEKNIRRRTYDALNVLIAAGVVQKTGKNIKLKLINNNNNNNNNSTQNNSNNKKRTNNTHTKRQLLLLQHITQQLQSKINHKQLILTKKHQQLESLLERKKNIKRFFDQKIRESVVIKAGDNDNKDDDDNDGINNKRIQFPFLCIKTMQQKFVKLTQQVVSKNNNNSHWDKENSSTCDQYRKQQKQLINLYFNSKNIHQCFLLQGDVDFISNIGHNLCHK